ncbi:MAG: hypothetical protein ACQETL_03705 [Bacteroidota bacterium]
MKNQPNKFILTILGLLAVIIIPIGFIFFNVVMNILVAGILSWPYWIGKLLDYTLEYIKISKWFLLIATLLFTLLGYFIYKIKKKALLIYGVLEFVAGFMTILYSLNEKYDDNTILALAIGGGMFLIVNGIENYHKGYKISENKKTKRDIKIRKK